ncbi:hypothetical protein CRM22_003094 [Opisthorchis felineus]|uniref:Uncharacterized protein n=1 Tax=Opisthorchis felineus TaxID=147828 RepID=A0A4S2M2X3_OPIFE|nr:hypothetical protein CRM22_003094 [Opisthorchis felineus]
MKSLERIFGIAIFFTLEAFLLIQLHRASSNPKNRLRLQSYGFLRAATGRLFTSFPTALLRDESDSDWDSLNRWVTYLPFYALYLVYSCSLEFILKNHSLIKCILRTVASSLLVLRFVGILLVADVLVLTVLFTVLGISFRGKRFIFWILTSVLFLAFDYLTDSQYYQQLLTRFVPESHAVGALVYSAHFLILLRSVSVAWCLADESHRISDGALEHGRVAPFRLWKTLWIVLETGWISRTVKQIPVASGLPS